MEALTQLGVGGIFAVLVIRSVLDFLAKREATKNGGARGTTSTHGMMATQQLNDLVRQVRELHEWHAKEDDDGVKVWYVRKSLEQSIARLADAAEQQTRALRDLVALIKADRQGQAGAGT